MKTENACSLENQVWFARQATPQPIAKSCCPDTPSAFQSFDRNDTSSPVSRPFTARMTALRFAGVKQSGIWLLRLSFRQGFLVQDFPRSLDVFPDTEWDKTYMSWR